VKLILQTLLHHSSSSSSACQKTFIHTLTHSDRFILWQLWARKPVPFESYKSSEFYRDEVVAIEKARVGYNYIQCVLKIHLKTCKFERDACVSMNSAKESGIQFLPLDFRLFFSFYSPSLHFSISHIQTALQQICSWMTADLLTLNSSKTEFLLIGLKQQLAEIQNCPLNTTSSEWVDISEPGD